MVLDRAKLLEHVALATVGVVISVLFTVCVKTYRNVYGTEPKAEDAMADDDGGGDVLMRALTWPLTFVQLACTKYWKILACYLVLMMMELVKAIDQGSVSVLRILMLQDTRESMRALYQGKGMPDMPSEGDAVLTDEDAAAKEAAEYANRWEAKKKQREEVK